ncbi:MAG TPA: LPS export ABC transporter permease LptF [Xanthomonadaceae bacterium]|nr:LPS export ABC transporter permease LptF [Xanthomonadaceae bacterium]
MRLPVIDRYVLRELVFTLLAVLAVLLLVSLGGVVADLLSKISRGKLPAALLFSQLGLRLVDAMPLMLPLALFLGVLLSISRLYRDSEVTVLAAAGVGIARLLRPIGLVVLPLSLLIGMCSFWASPASQQLSRAMIDAANRSLLVAGMEPGRFVELPGRHSVVYLAEMAPDGSSFERLFVHSEHEGRIDVITATSGELFSEAQGEERYLSLTEGFRVEGEVGADDYRLMRFARNDIRVPDSEPAASGRDEQRMPTLALLGSVEPAHRAELHWRVGAPLAAVLLGLLAVPLARTPPRSSRHGRLLLAVLSYIVYLNLLALGRVWIAQGQLPAWVGLWWVHVPVLGFALWMLWRDQRIPRPDGG